MERVPSTTRLGHLSTHGAQRSPVNSAYAASIDDHTGAGFEHGLDLAVGVAPSGGVVGDAKPDHVRSGSSVDEPLGQDEIRWFAPDQLELRLALAGGDGVHGVARWGAHRHATDGEKGAATEVDQLVRPGAGHHLIGVAPDVARHRLAEREVVGTGVLVQPGRQLRRQVGRPSGRERGGVVVEADHLGRVYPRRAGRSPP